MRCINICCDASQRQVERTELNPRGRKVSFAAWIADTGHYWYDLIYAKRSHDAEVTAVLVALHWALGKEYERINLYTDDRSIYDSLNGRYKGRGMGDLPELLKVGTAEVNIIPIQRKQNKAAHNLCIEAYEAYICDGIFPRKARKTTNLYLTQDAILRAKKLGWMKTVYEPSTTYQQRYRDCFLGISEELPSLERGGYSGQSDTGTYA